MVEAPSEETVRKYKLSGTITSGNTAVKTVTAYRRSDGTILGSTNSREDNTWALYSEICSDEDILIICRDEGGDFNADVYDRVSLCTVSLVHPGDFSNTTPVNGLLHSKDSAYLPNGLASYDYSVIRHNLQKDIAKLVFTDIYHSATFEDSGQQELDIAVTNTLLTGGVGINELPTGVVLTISSVEPVGTDIVVPNFTSIIVNPLSEETVLATTNLNTSYKAYYSCDPNRLLTGTWSGIQWLSLGGQVTNQKFNVTLPEPTVPRRIKIDNSHSNGGSYNTGVKDVTFYGTNSEVAFNNVDYDDITDLTEIGTLEIRMHGAVNAADTTWYDLDGREPFKYMVLRCATNHGNTSYMGIRSIEFQADPMYNYVLDQHTVDISNIYSHCLNMDSLALLGFVKEPDAMFSFRGAWDDVTGVHKSYVDGIAISEDAVLLNGSSAIHMLPTCSDVSIGASVGDESDIDIVCRFQATTPNVSSHVLYKSGDDSNGIAIGFDSGTLGIFGNLNGVVTSITLSSSYVVIGSWYYIHCTKSSVVLYDDMGIVIASEVGEALPGIGDGQESVGGSCAGSPLSALPDSGEFFYGNVSDVSVYQGDTSAPAYPSELRLACEVGETGQQCYVEVEKWDMFNKTAELWVKLPTLPSDADTVLRFYLHGEHAPNIEYVGNIGDLVAQNVWDSSYIAVYHMVDESGTIKDSTANALHLTLTGGTTVSSMIGDAVLFDGIDGIATVIDAGFEITDTGLTYEAVLNRTEQLGTLSAIATKGQAGGNLGALLGVPANSDELQFGTGTDYISGGVIEVGSPVNIAATYNGTDDASGLSLYASGLALSPTETGTFAGFSASAEPFTVGGESDDSVNTSFMNGGIDELRISSVARTPDYIELTDKSNSDNLFTFDAGSEEESTSYSFTIPVTKEIDQYTTLLVSSDTTDGDIQFYDTSPSDNTITVVGAGTEHSTTRSKYGTSSMYYPNTYHALSIPASDGFVFGMDDFTIDFWANPEIVENFKGLFSVDNSYLLLETIAGGTYRVMIGGVQLISSPTVTFVAGKWVHIAVVCKDNMVSTYVNGKLDMSAENAVDLTCPADFHVNHPVFSFIGYIDEFRVSKGIARWSEDFVPYLTDYSKHIDMEGTLQDFPLLLTFGEGSGFTGIDSSVIVQEAGLLSTDGTVVYPKLSASIDNVPCYLEIEKWDSTTSSAKVWCKAHEISNVQDTVIQVRYGEGVSANYLDYIGVPATANAMKVWDDNFLGVYHMSQDPSLGVVLDSSGSANHGTPSGDIQIADGIIGDSYFLDGAGDYITLPNAVTLQHDSMTVEAIASATASGDVLIGDSSATNYVFHLSGTLYHKQGASQSYAVGADLFNGELQQWVTRVGADTTVPDFFIDGIKETGNGSISATPINIDYIGRYITAGSNDWLGGVDEVRFSNVPRSDDWLTLTSMSNTDRLLEVQQVEVSAGLAGWETSNRLNITIPAGSVPSDLSNFPVLISLTAATGIYSFDAAPMFMEMGADLNKIAIEHAVSGSECYVEVSDISGELLQGSAANKNMVTSSTMYTSTYIGTNVFNGDLAGSPWISTDANGPNTDGSCWLQWDFGTQETITMARMQRRPDAGTENCPCKVAFYASATGVFGGEQVLVGEGSSINIAVGNWANWIVLENPVPTQYLRMEIHSMHESGTTKTWVTVNEVEFTKVPNSAQLWVNVPSISSSTDTELVLYYDKEKDNNIDYVGNTNTVGTLLDFTGSILHTSWSGKNNLRVTVGREAISVNGTHIRVEFARTTRSTYYVLSCFVGYKDMSTGLYNFEEEPVRVTFEDGAGGIEVPIGTGSVFSDPIPFAADASRDMVVSFFLNTADLPYNSTVASPDTVYYFLDSAGASDESDTMVPTGYSDYAGTLFLVGVEAVNPVIANVWDDSFVLVNHMNQNPIPLQNGITATIVDSTGTSTKQVLSGTLTAPIDGKIGDALVFDGTNSITPNIGEALLEGTIEVIAQHTGGLGTYNALYGKGSSFISGGVSVCAADSSHMSIYVQGDGSFCCEVLADFTEFIGFTATIDDTEVILTNMYSGESDSYQRANLSIQPDNMIGNFSTTGGPWTGSIDEVRVSSVKRSDDWIAVTKASNDDTLIEVVQGTITGATGMEGWESAQFIDIEIDGTLVPEAVENFPVLIKVGHTSGTGAFDSSAFLEELDYTTRKKFAIEDVATGEQCPVEIMEWEDTVRSEEIPRTEGDTIGNVYDPYPDAIFDGSLGGNADQAWYAYEGGIYLTAAWIGKQYETPYAVNKVRINNFTITTYNPRNFTVDGSHDGFTWDVVHTVTDYPQTLGWDEVTFENSVAYSYWRINVTENYGSASYLIIAELEFWKMLPKEALLWVKVPSIVTGAPTNLRLYYDNTNSDNSMYVGEAQESPTEATYAGAPATVDYGWGGVYSLRSVIDASMLQVVGDTIRIKLIHNVTDWYIDEAFIGHAATSGNVYDFDDSQVPITFNGNTSVEVTEEAWSDWIQYTIDPTKNLIISADFTTTDSLPAANPATGVVGYYKAENGVTGDSVVTGYASVASIQYAFGTVQVLNTPSINVWDEYFAAVYHMNQDPSTGGACILDSTANANHGTPYGTWDGSELVSATIGKALAFNGASQYIDFGQDDSLGCTAVTLESTFQNHDLGYNTLVEHASASTANYDITLTNGNLYFQWDNGGWKNQTSLYFNQLDTWYDLAITHDGAGTVNFIEDGVLVSKGSSNTAIQISGSNNAVAGSYQFGTYGYANITEQEVRISTVARSVSWLQVSRLTKSDSLLSYSKPVDGGGVIQHLNPLDGWSVHNGFTATIASSDVPSEQTNIPVRISISESSGKDSTNLTFTLAGMEASLAFTGTEVQDYQFGTSKDALAGFTAGNLKFTENNLNAPDSAMVFDGSGNDIVTVDESFRRAFSSGQLTLSMYIKFDSFCEDKRLAVLGTHYYNEMSLEIDFTGTYKRLLCRWGYNTSYWDQLLSGNIFDFDIWYHVAIVRDYVNRKAYLYVDGEVVATLVMTDRIDPGVFPILIGDNQAYPPFAGSISDLTIWDEVLAPTEISSLLTNRNLLTYTGNYSVNLITSTNTEFPLLLGSSISSVQVQGDSQDQGMDMACTVDGSTYHVYVDEQWVAIASKDPLVHGVTDNTTWHFLNGANEWVFSYDDPNDAIAEAFKFPANVMTMEAFVNFNTTVYAELFVPSTGIFDIAVCLKSEEQYKVPEFNRISFNNEGCWSSDVYDLEPHSTSIAGSNVQWSYSEADPTGFFKVYVITTGDTEWTECTINGGSIPLITPAMNTVGIHMQFKVVFDTIVDSSPEAIGFEFNIT